MKPRRLNVTFLSKLFLKYNKVFKDDIEARNMEHMGLLKEIIFQHFDINDRCHIDVLDKIKFFRGYSDANISESLPIFLMKVEVKKLEHKGNIILTWNLQDGEWMIDDVKDEVFDNPNFDDIIREFCEL